MKFKYDTRLNQTEIYLFEDLIGKSISSLRLETAFINPPPNFSVNNIGKCYINFYSKETGHFAKMELTSLFQETPPIVDSGGISVKKILKKDMPLKTSKNLKHMHEKNSIASISYPENSTIRSFKFFGSKERGKLKDLYPDLKDNSLKSQEVEVDTIEFLVIVHNNCKKTVITSDSGGFRFNFLINQKIDDKLIYDSYMKVNGYEKNIVLHHEII